MRTSGPTGLLTSEAVSTATAAERVAAVFVLVPELPLPRALLVTNVELRPEGGICVR